MKLIIEKVAEGVKITVANAPNEKPTWFIVRPGEVEMLTTLLRSAMAAEKFRFEYQQ